MVEARAWRLRRRESRPPRTQGLRRLRTQRPRKTPAASSARPGCPISPAPWRMARGSARARHVCAHRAPREGEAPRGGELARIGPEEVRERYGVDPKQVPDFIALRGDPSDKLPGAPGVGPKRAGQLLWRYGTLDGVLDTDLFQTEAEILRLFRLIATMDAKAPLPSLTDQEPGWASASTLARRWGSNQLADRLDEKVRHP
jgi:hypothetical protein